MYYLLLHLAMSFILAWSLVGSYQNDHDEQKIKISVSQVSGDKVQIHWQSAYKNVIKTCELSIKPSHGSSMRVIQNFIPSVGGFQVDTLKPSVEYTIYMICHDDQKNIYSSNFVNFKTRNDTNSSFVPVSKDTKYRYHHRGGAGKYTDNPQVYREKLTTTVSALDIALGVVFSLFGVVIIVSGAFYFWRKYQRRQRIRRFTRHQDTDSFPDLQTEDSSSDVAFSSQPMAWVL